MAIFSYEYLQNMNEDANEVQEESSLLDSLYESCEEIATILEGGARQKYAKLLDDKDKKLADERSKIYDEKEKLISKGILNREYYNTTSSQKVKDKLDKEYEEDGKKAEDNKNKLGKNTAEAVRIQDRRQVYTAGAEKHRLPHFDTGKNTKNNKESADAFKDKFHSHDKDKLAEKRPNMVKDMQDKKRAVKETCLYILSILDDID